MLLIFSFADLSKPNIQRLSFCLLAGVAQIKAPGPRGPISDLSTPQVNTTMKTQNMVTVSSFLDSVGQSSIFPL